MAVLALTGPSGSIATQIRPLLAQRGHEVRLVHRRFVAPKFPTEEFHHAELDDSDALIRAFAGTDLVVHLAGISSETEWPSLVSANILGTQQVLDAAKAAGVKRVLLASSNHAVGMVATDELPDIPVPVAAPDSLYGVSKATVEALGGLYGQKFGLSVVSARIGTATPKPHGVRGLHTWFSPADCVRLVEAAAMLTDPGHWIVWGISANRRGWVNHSASAEIGFTPQDDAEVYAAEVLAESPADSNLETLGAATPAES